MTVFSDISIVIPGEDMGCRKCRGSNHRADTFTAYLPYEGSQSADEGDFFMKTTYASQYRPKPGDGCYV